MTELDWIGSNTLKDLIEDKVLLFADKPCMVLENQNGSVQTFTYAEFREEIRRVAATFQRVGVTKGDRVVILLPNCVEFVLAWFGAVWIGAVAVPANVANTAPEMQHVIVHSGAKIVITSAKLRPVIDSLEGGIPSIEKRFTIDEHDVSGWLHFASSLDSASELEEVDVFDTDVAQFVFTSGTTSRPKAVMLTHANCLHSGVRGAYSAGAGETDRILSSLPAFHVNAQSFTILAALTVGATFVLLEQYRATKFIEQMRRHEATIVSLVAMQVRTLLAQPPRDNDTVHSVRRSIFAMTISAAEHDLFEERFGITLLNGYGLSEVMTGVSVVPLHGRHHWPSIGLPIIGLRVRLVDESGADAPPGVPGEIVVQGVPGRTIMKGYYNDDAATSAAIRDGWLHTGDIAYANEDGYLYFVDRLKDVIKRAGENISASEVEATLAAHPAVLEAAVIGVPDAIRDEAVKAFVVLRPGAVVTAEELILHCTQNLAAFKVPYFVEFRDQLPKTSIGKVEKKLLRAESLQSS